MDQANDQIRVLMLGGTSNVGKSTLARALADRLGWDCVSTDRLARHPGRPWPVDGRDVPAHVASHYLDLAVDDLIASVLAHYETMAPAIELLVRTHGDDPGAPRLILEGSAVLPARAPTAGAGRVRAVWLLADAAFIDARIRATSGYDSADGAGRILIDKFIARSRRFNDIVGADVARRGLAHVVVRDGLSVDALAHLCLAAAGVRSEV
jgi:hypothetical protein